MAVFRPKRNWKPKRRERNPQKRRKRQQWWRKNRNRLKAQRRRRYKQLKNNPTFKRWRQKRQREKSKRRMRTASADIWFIFKNGEAPDIGLGYIIDYDPDEEEFLVFDVENSEELTVEVGDFLRNSEFLGNRDLDRFNALMDKYYPEISDMMSVTLNPEA